jgi:hypothetical protein
MASVQTDYSEVNDYATTGVDSHRIYFRSTAVGIYRDESFGTDDTLVLTGADLAVNSDSSTTSRLYFGNQSSGEVSLTLEDNSFDSFYFKHAGTIGGSSVQAGKFMVHDETNAVNPSSPGSINYAELHVDSNNATLTLGDSGGNYGELYFDAANNRMTLTSTDEVAFPDGHDVRFYDGSNYLRVYHGTSRFNIETSGDDLWVVSDVSLYLGATTTISLDATTSISISAGSGYGISFSGTSADFTACDGTPSGAGLVIPSVQPNNPIAGSMYLSIGSPDLLSVYDGTHWNYVQLTQV